MNLTIKEFAEALADAHSSGYKDGVASVKPTIDKYSKGLQ